MNTDTIFAKYADALYRIGKQHGTIQPQAVDLALRLAIADAAALAQPVGQDPRTIERTFNQIVQLNEWLETNRTDLYFDGAYDTAQAILAALASLEFRLATALEERATALEERDVAEAANRRLRDWLAANVAEHSDLDDTELVIHTITALRAQLATPVGHVSNVTDQRVAQNAINQIGRLNEWLGRNWPTLYCEMDLDTATAMIRACEEMTRIKVALHEERDNLRQKLAQLDQATAGTGATPVGHVSNVTDPPPAPAAALEERAAAWWTDLDTETNDYRISLDAGRRTFRQLPKSARLLLAQAVARHIGSGNLPKQSDFDAHKPAWMPTATGLVGTLNCTWHDLLTLDPATVAP